MGRLNHAVANAECRGQVLASRDSLSGARRWAAVRSGLLDSGGGTRVVTEDTRVEVRSRFDGSWCRGFEIVTVVNGGEGFRVRQLSDGAVLPALFSADDIAEERAALVLDRP